MQVTINIKSCEDCKYIGHSGAFTVRGARDICGHSDACTERVSKSAFRREYPGYKKDIYEDWKYHWIHRVLSSSSGDRVKGIPKWCPLKTGSGY